MIADNFPVSAPDHDMYRVVGVGEFIIRTATSGRDPLPCKLADLVVLSADILELEASDRLDDLRHVSSVLTIVDGDIVYSDGNLINKDSDDDRIWYRKERESRCVME